jgi:hypothetical protein
VSPPRRDVRPTRDFFADLNQQLTDQWGPNGEPSRVDFQTHNLLAIIDRFGTGWDGLPHLIRGRADYRVLVSKGVLVPAISVEAQLTRDGVIELLRLRIDLTWPYDPDEEEAAD